MNKQTSQALGWAAGVIVTFPLIIYGINYFFKDKFNNCSKATSKYIQNCSEYRLFIPKSLNLRTTSYASSLLAPKESIYNLMFEEPSINKFLVIKFFNFPMDKRLAFRPVVKEKILSLTINKNDLDDPNYGTANNPIPVFRVREDLPDSISKTRGAEDGWNVDITENQFKYNVEQYLTYIMPKDEFKKRFEKK